MKVLHVGPKNFPPAHGGVEKVVYDLVTGMPDVESHVFVEWRQDAPVERVCTLPKGLWRQYRAVSRYARRNGIDVIHIHKEAFVPLGMLLKLAGWRCVATIHGCPWRLRRWPMHIRAAFFTLDYLATCVFDKTAFVGEPDWRLFRKLAVIRKPVLVRNGVPGGVATAVDARKGAVYVGRLSPEKNVLRLAQAADKANVPLDLYGPMDRRDHNYTQTLLAAVEQSPWVCWRGPIDFSEVRPTLAKYRVFINPSFAEGLPVSVLEAAAEGLHLVLSDIPQHRSLAMPQCTYVDPSAIDLRPELRDQAADAALNRHHVRREFDISATTQAYLGLYRQALGRTGKDEAHPAGPIDVIGAELPMTRV